MRRRLAAPLLVAALVAAACSSGPSAGEAGPSRTTTPSRRPARTTTTTTVPPSTTTTAATVPVLPATARAAPQPATATCPPVPARAPLPADRPRYTLTAEVRLAENAVVGETRVRFTPDLGTDRVVFRLWANSPRTAAAGARLEVGPVVMDGRPTGSRLDEATTLTVALNREPLRPGDAVEVAVPFRLALPGEVQDRISRSGDAVRLGSWFPILAWEPGIGWATQPPTSGFAEASVAMVADFEATVVAPEGLTVLATGVPQGAGRWLAAGVRDFAVSVGRFRLASGTAHAPHPVAVTVGVHDTIAEAPDAYLGRVVQSLERMSAWYGPYPWPVYTVSITPGLRGGIEYPMHVLQGPETIGRTTSHEVAHMWFYGLVGNNQGRDPWLDEGLASYAEARFEGTEADFRARAVPPGGRGRMGEPMAYWETRQDIYYRSVYVQGAQALLALGPVDRVDCGLRQYVARAAHRVARPADLRDALATVFPDAGAVLARYGARFTP